MNLEVSPKKAREINDELVMLSYWAIIYQNIQKKINIDDKDVLLVKYEEIINNCIDTTSNIFKFAGCKNIHGTDHYSKPENYKWKWGSDDGGNVIKSLKVQNFKRKRINQKLISLIENIPEVQDLLISYGYKK